MTSKSETLSSFTFIPANSSSYGTLSIAEEDIKLNSVNHNEELNHSQKKVLITLGQLVVFISCFLFYGYCIFEALSPISIHDDDLFLHRRLDDGSTSSSTSCTLTSKAAEISVGAVAGAALVAGVFLVAGLSPLGPLAGGWFASQMGAGLAAGSALAALQSAAMTGTTYATGAAVGAVTGAATSC
eukprot:gene5565-6127_t